MPSNQSQSLKQVYGKAKFQNGGHSYAERPPEERGLAIAKIDLRDAFFLIPIHKNRKKFLRLIFKEEAYQFNCLPFGLSSAPWVFTKTLKPALANLRERGMYLIAHIDNPLILVESRELILDHVTGMWYILECLGFIVNTKKSVLNPAQVIEFLGLSMDSITMEIRLSQ